MPGFRLRIDLDHALNPSFRGQLPLTSHCRSSAVPCDGTNPHVRTQPTPPLIDKIRDVVGLYLAPPENTVVFAVDEKPQIQALERTAPVLPIQEARSQVKAMAVPVAIESFAAWRSCRQT